MPRYEIWSEGFRATGESGTATYHGESEGSNFVEACKNFAARHEEFAKYYNPKSNAYWACSLFDNESDARKTFG